LEGFSEKDKGFAMKRSVLILLLLLIVWIAGSSYWYVCRTRCDCRTKTEKPVPSVPAEAAGNPRITDDSAVKPLKSSLTEAENYLKNKGDIIIYFKSGSASADTGVIPSEYIEKLKLLLENKPDSKILVSGHADTSGPTSENEKLSQMRAEFVKAFLVSSGIPSDKVETVYKSDNQPISSNNTPEGRSKNRRAEIKTII